MSPTKQTAPLFCLLAQLLSLNTRLVCLQPCDRVRPSVHPCACVSVWVYEAEHCWAWLISFMTHRHTLYISQNNMEFIQLCKGNFSKIDDCCRKGLFSACSGHPPHIEALNMAATTAHHLHLQFQPQPDIKNLYMEAFQNLMTSFIQNKIAREDSVAFVCYLLHLLLSPPFFFCVKPRPPPLCSPLCYHGN